MKDRFDFEKQKWEDAKNAEAAAAAASGGGSSKNKEAFPGLRFKMSSDNSATVDIKPGIVKGGQGNFSRRKGQDKKIDFTDLSEAMQSNLIVELKKYGLTPNDIEVHKDYDWWNDNHYIVLLKSTANTTNTTTDPVVNPIDTTTTAGKQGLYGGN